MVEAQQKYYNRALDLLQDLNFNIVGIDIKEESSIATFDGDPEFLSKYGVDLEDVIQPTRRKLTVYFTERLVDKKATESE